MNCLYITLLLNIVAGIVLGPASVSPSHRSVPPALAYNCQMHIRVMKKLRGLSPRANYTDRAAAAGRRS